MRLIYTILHYLLAPGFVLHLIWRGVRSPAYWQRWPERFGYYSGLETLAPVIWVHAVSVGEVQAALPLVRALLARYPEHHILITTTTPTGSERVTQSLGELVTHCYVPYDLPGAVKRFLARFNPVIAIILETELWPNIFHYCRMRGTRVLLANARLSMRSARRYSRVPVFAAQMLAGVDAIAAQTEDDARRLITLGARARCVQITGSVKFDMSLPASVQEQAQAIRRMWGVERGVWIAASTHEGEDEQVLEAFRLVRDQLPHVLLVLVPRHPERFARVTGLCRRYGYCVVNRSDKSVSCLEADIFVGDSMGELALFYAAADVAFVGGSLVETGGHNMLEPAALGVPVIVGPHVFNFNEISRRLCEVGASVQIDNLEQLAMAVIVNLKDANLRHATGQKGRTFVDSNRGAGDRVMQMIGAMLVS